MPSDPRTIIASSRMTSFQVVAVAVTIALNMLDGFDVVAISFAGPGIAREWGLPPGGLGLVLSTSLAGMAGGSLVLAPMSDVVGRRPMILFCLLAMTVGMLASATASDVYQLSAWRVLTGLGIGAMLASINAMASEFSSDRRRELCVALMAVGYPLGVVAGGSVSAELLKAYDWRSVFLFGGLVSALLVPVVLWRLPESIASLMQRQPPNALERINATLARMGHASVSELPPRPPKAERGSPVDVFKPALLPVTIALAGGYFLHMLTFYYMQTWIPKLMVDMGFTPSQGAEVLVAANFGGIFGALVLGGLAARIGLKPLTILLLALTGAVVIAFGQVGRDLNQLKAVVAVAGFGWNAAIVGFYALCARAYPTYARATGTGFMLGFGRIGAVAAPIIAGELIGMHYGIPLVSLLMALGSFAGALVLLAVLRNEAIAVAKA